MKLYGWDTNDPMLKAWSKAFPGSVSPLSEISGDLMAHVRYPQDLLKVQRELLTEYHVTDPNSFSGSRLLAGPARPVVDHPGPAGLLPVDRDAGRGPRPPSRSRRPSCRQQHVAGREILRGLLAVDSDAGTQAGKPAEDYGLLRLLEYGSATPAGPGQVLNQIQVSTARSQSPAEPLKLASSSPRTRRRASS